MATGTGLVGILSGAGFIAPECNYTLKEGAAYKNTLPDAPKKRIDDLFHATITHKNQFNANCFNYTIERWKDFFLSNGAKDMLLYGSSSRQSLDKFKEFSQEYINEPLEPREDKSADMDFLILLPGADKKERAKVLDEVLKMAIKEMYPDGNAPPNEIHRLRRTLFVNLSNKDGKGRYAHLKFLIFSLNSSIRLNGRDIPLKIDFVISGNHYPLLFNIDQFQLSVVNFLNGERFSPVLKDGLQDILQLSRRRLIPNPEINYDELSFIKRLNRSLQGFYLPFSEDEKFVEVVMDPSLHRKSKKLTSGERQTIELEKAQSNFTDKETKEFIKKLKKRLSFEDIQAKAFEKYFNCSISLTLFAFQLRLMFKRDLIRLQKLVPIVNPTNWQEKFINWMQGQLYNPAFLDKIPSLSFLLLVKMLEGDPNIRIYEDALRIRIQVQKVTVFLFLPLSKLESSSRYLNEIKEVLNIRDEKNALYEFLLSQIVIKDQKSFDQLFALIKSEAPSLLSTLPCVIWILRAYQIGWISKEMALEHALDHDDYFNALERDEQGFGRDYLKKFPNTARTLAYFADRSFQLDEIRKCIPASEDIDSVLVKLSRNFDVILNRLRQQKDLYHRFDPDFFHQIVEELIFRRGHYDLTDLMIYYLANFRNMHTEMLAVIFEPEAYLFDLERLLDFVKEFPYPVPLSLMRHAISLVLKEPNSSHIEELHDLYINLRGERGDVATYMRVFLEEGATPHKIYKPLDDCRQFYIQFYFEVCMQLLDKLRAAGEYDFILNQLLLILPDLKEDEIKGAIDKWLQVRHVKKDHMIDHFTTSLARLSNFMDKTLSKTKKINRLREKIILIAGLADPTRRIPFDVFKEAMEFFSLDDPFLLEQVLFIVTNCPISIRQCFDQGFCDTLFEKSLRAFRTSKNREQILEGLIYAILGSDKATNSVCLFYPNKKLLIEKCLFLIGIISDFCYEQEVTAETINIFLSGVRLMQLLKDRIILNIDDNAEYRSKADDFIITAKKYVHSSLAKTDLRGAMNYVYKGSTLHRKFLGETATFLEMYCTLT